MNFKSASKKKKNNLKCLERENERESERDVTHFYFLCRSSRANHDPRHFTLLLLNITCMGAIQ